MSGGLGLRPANELIAQSGDWALRALLISLAITPLRQLLRWPALIGLRRMVGVAACLYGLLHLSAFAWDNGFRWTYVLTETILRFYLTIGAVALIGLVALAVTSTDEAARHLGGKRWQKLHNSVYAVAALSLLHFFLQTGLNLYQPVLLAGFFAWLMAYRLLGSHARSTLCLLLLTAGCGLATSLSEAGYYAVFSRLPAGRILLANLHFTHGLRPGVWVLLAGLLLLGVAMARNRTVPTRPTNSKRSAGKGWRVF
ncbi:MAG TPA: protein-methionine-sulfoxide reductase heme-binding subunit MsrQ [Dongiaceae bacterium]|jgi:sulfoxide reductase heme-binding subunit YedZ|nr:protein-methionine-sulfoxide reductase heme-binding subunit MsrQ [Dongiaceae bacterium]